MSSQKQPQSEEVDLGSLFKVIGKGFKNFFTAIGQFFKYVFHLIIMLLLFVRNNALKLGLAAIIGAAVGFYFDFNKKDVFESTMLVEPNFRSTRQLYQSVDYYNELVRQEDTLLLAASLKISTKDARILKGFYIEPIKNENEKYEHFNKFIDDLDTTTVRNIEIKDFKKAFTLYDYRFHRITVKSLDNTIFTKLETPIISSIEDNSYFKTQKRIHDENLEQNELVLKKSLNEVDTLRKIYNEVMITEAKKTAAGTSITMAEGANKTNEIELFNESLKLNQDLIDNNTAKAETSEIINVVSSFSPIGTKEREIFKKYTVLFAIGFGLLMLLFLFFRQLNTYLINYERLRKS